MDKRIVRWLALLVVANVATACAQSKVGTASTALPFGPSVTANGMAGIGVSSRGESDFTINPALLTFIDRAASVGAFPILAEPYQVSDDSKYFAASLAVSPQHLLGRSNSRLQFTAGFSWQELKYKLYEVTYEGEVLHRMISTTRQAAVGAGYHWWIDLGCGLDWRRLSYGEEGRELTANTYDFGAVARLPLGQQLPSERSWREGPLFARLVGSAVWTNYGPKIQIGEKKYAQAHGRRYGLAAELAYRWLSLCPAIEREASPGYHITIMHYGGELALADILSLRGGKIDYREQDYLGSDQLTFGFGLSTHGLKRLVWSQGETAPTTPWWRRFDVEFSFALMCDADELVEATEFYELRLTY
jgi:hypothetical protein